LNVSRETMINIQNNCKICNGPFSTETGHVFRETFCICGPCADNFYQWYRLRMINMNRVIPPNKKSFNEIANETLR
jgi:hypothetical protein